MEYTGTVRKVKCPDGAFDNLTPGKEYDVLGYWENPSEKLGDCFEILNDIDKNAMCVEFNCAHLNRHDWIVTERSTPQT